MQTRFAFYVSVAALVLGALGVGIYSLWPAPAPAPDHESTGVPDRSTTEVQPPQLVGAGPQAGPGAGAQVGSEGSRVDSALGVYLRARLPETDVGTVNPHTAHQVVGDAPGGIEALIKFCLDSPPETQGELLVFAREVVTRYLATASLDHDERVARAEQILSAFDAAADLSPHQLLPAMEWLWRLGGQGSAFSGSEWTAPLIRVADPLLKSDDLRGHRALARLDVAPGVVASALLSTLRHLKCPELERSAYLLVDPAILDVVRAHGERAEEALVEKLEACGTAATSRAALALRAARRDPWSVFRARLQRLAVQPSLSSPDYTGCLREALMYSPNDGIRDLPSLLRLRPGMRIEEVGALLAPSLDWLQSVNQVAELVEDGSLYWDAELMRLRLGS